jgi:hypothetical protein
VCYLGHGGELFNSHSCENLTLDPLLFMMERGGWP